MRTLFPDWKALEQHKEVIRFACGLQTASAHTMQFVYDLFADNCVDSSGGSIDYNYLDSDSEEFLESLWKETSHEGPVDPLHNRYINLMREYDSDLGDGSEGNDRGLKGKDVRIFVPSLHFIFPGERDACKFPLFTIDNSLLSNRTQAECILFAKNDDDLYDTLKILQHVGQYQEVSVKTFVIGNVYITADDLANCEETVDPTSLLLEMIEARVRGSNDEDDSHVLQFLELCSAIMSSESDSTEIIQLLSDMITNAAEAIATDPIVQVIQDIIRPKLNLINNFDRLDSVRSLGKLFIETVKINRFATNVQVEDCILPPQVMMHLMDQLRGCNDIRYLVFSQLELSDNLGDTINSTPSLETVELSGILEKANDRLLAWLSHSRLLKVLGINRCTLSDQVSYLFGNQDHPGFRQLKELRMVEAKLSTVDLKSISSAVTNGKLPLLTSLDLSSNVLTDCMIDLLGDSNQPRFLCLKHLNLSNAKLSKNDLGSLAVAVRCDKLPKVKILDLSSNVLTDCMIDLLGDSNQPRLLCLKHLDLSNAKLSKNDLGSLAVAVRCDKLPKVKILDLSDNVLTDILSTLIPLTDHPGYKSLTQLYVMNCKLSLSDVKNVLTAFRIGKLPNLIAFHGFPQISRGWLSDFLITDHPACPKVVSLDLKKQELSASDIKAISDAAKRGKFDQLKEINLSENALTDCLGDLFGSTDYPSFPLLETLQLENTSLTKDDLNSIFETLRDDKLPDNLLPLTLVDHANANAMRGICTLVNECKLLNLKDLDLSENRLTNCMSDLFGSFDSPGFIWFRRLCLNNCELSEADVMSIVHARTKLANLQELDLSNNTLTDLIESLMSGTDPPGFLNLRTLRLKSSRLSKADLEILGNLIHAGNLPKLCELDLSENILADCLRNLLGIECEVQPLSLSQLLLENTCLSKDDVHCMSTALTLFQLPNLELLSLKENSLCSVEKEIEMLIQSFSEFTINLDGQGMRLDLRGNNFSEEFTERMDHFDTEPLIQIKD